MLGKLFNLEHGKLQGPVGHTSGETRQADGYMGLQFKSSIKDINLESSNAKTT